MFGIVVVDLTTKCNFKCPHCLRGKRAPQDLSMDLLDKFYTEGHDVDLGLISISGGEPILHSHFFENIDLIVRHGYKFNYVSNGYLYREYEDVLKYREKLECMIISIDGVTKESYSKMRGDIGFERAWEAVKFYSDKGVYMKVQVVLSGANQHEAEELVEKAVKYGAKEISFTGIITEYDDTYALTQEQKSECWNKINTVARRYNIAVTRCAALGNFGGIDFCRALTATCAPRLSPTGDFYTCCDIWKDDISVGNIADTSYGELFQKAIIVNGYLRALRLKYFKEESNKAGFNSCEFCVRHIEEAMSMFKDKAYDKVLC